MISNPSYEFSRSVLTILVSLSSSRVNRNESTFNPLPFLCPSHSPSMGIITHIVSFKYKSTASSSERHLVASSFLALQSRCLDSQGKPYIAVTGGKQNSPEQAGKGFDVSFSESFSDFTGFRKVDDILSWEEGNSIRL